MHFSALNFYFAIWIHLLVLSPFVLFFPLIAAPSLYSGPLGFVLCGWSSCSDSFWHHLEETINECDERPDVQEQITLPTSFSGHCLMTNTQKMSLDRASLRPLCLISTGSTPQP